MMRGSNDYRAVELIVMLLSLILKGKLQGEDAITAVLAKCSVLYAMLQLVPF